MTKKQKREVLKAARRIQAECEADGGFPEGVSFVACLEMALREVRDNG